jgi:MraZ protein
VFKGTYRHRIDPKGRIPVPAAFRRQLAEAGESALVVTLLDQCLAAYPPSQWRRLESQLAALPAFSKPVKALTRLLTSRAADCELDSQGRILLPPSLRQAAGLARETVVVGVLNRFELWAPEPWEDFVRDSESLLDDLTLDIDWPVSPVPSPGPPAAPSATPAREPGLPQDKP